MIQGFSIETFFQINIKLWENADSPTARKKSSIQQIARYFFFKLQIDHKKVEHDAIVQKIQCN